MEGRWQSVIQQEGSYCNQFGWHLHLGLPIFQTGWKYRIINEPDDDIKEGEEIKDAV